MAPAGLSEWHGRATRQSPENRSDRGNSKLRDQVRRWSGDRDVEGTPTQPPIRVGSSLSHRRIPNNSLTECYRRVAVLLPVIAQPPAHCQIVVELIVDRRHFAGIAASEWLIGVELSVRDGSPRASGVLGTLAWGEITPVGPPAPQRQRPAAHGLPWPRAAPVRERIVKRLHNGCEQTPACGRPTSEAILASSSDVVTARQNL
jgi:hypothetical protein